MRDGVARSVLAPPPHHHPTPGAPQQGAPTYTRKASIKSAMFLASMFDWGLGVEKDKKRSFEAWLICAKSGIALAQHVIGIKLFDQGPMHAARARWVRTRGGRGGCQRPQLALVLGGPALTNLPPPALPPSHASPWFEKAVAQIASGSLDGKLSLDHLSLVRSCGGSVR